MRQAAWIVAALFCSSGAAVAQNGSPDGLLSTPQSQTADSSTLVFPFFAEGGGYQTVLSLANYSITATTVTVQPYLGSGLALAPTTLSLAANGTARVSMVGESLAVGWLRVTTEPPVNVTGAAALQLFSGTTLISEASALPAILDTAMRLPVLEKEGFQTGLSLANIGTTTATATLTLRHPDGSVRDNTTSTLGPFGQTSLYVSQLFPGASAFEGSLEIETADGTIAALAVKQHSSGIFSTVPVAQTSRTVESYFSPLQGTAGRIVAVVDGARSSLDIAIFSFTRNEIGDALLAAKARGVQLRILTDSDQADGLGSEIERLEAAGVPIKRTAGGSLSGDMHNKYMIVDGRVLLTGSYNWSTRAEEDSFENMVLIRHGATVADYEANFDSIWNSR